MDFNFQDILMIFPIWIIRSIVITLFVVWIGTAVYGLVKFHNGKIKEFTFIGIKFIKK